MLGTSPVPAGRQRFDVPISLVVLGRDSWLYRATALEELYALGFAEILCVDTAPLKYETDDLFQRCPGIRLLLLQQNCSPGEKINLAAEEVQNDRFLVLWDNQKLPEAGLHSKVAKFWLETPALVLVPGLRDAYGQEIPGVVVPSLDNNHLRLLVLPAEEELTPTLFPQDFAGLYDRGAFLRSGGFDPSLAPWWQKADWGLRCHLWGETMVLASSFRVEQTVSVEPDDQSVGSGNRQLYLRNLSLRFAGDHAVLPWSRFFPFWWASGTTLVACLDEFRKARSWVTEHRYRFKTDAKLLLERWGQRR